MSCVDETNVPLVDFADFKEENVRYIKCVPYINLQWCNNFTNKSGKVDITRLRVNSMIKFPSQID